jgi:hypothetical protein
MRTVVAVRSELTGQVLDSAGECVTIEPTSKESLYMWVSFNAPQILLLDEGIGAGAWKALSEVPRLCGLSPQTKVILLADGLDERRERLAAMAGCYDAIDVSDSSWPADLEESLRYARRRVRLLGQLVQVAASGDVVSVFRHKSASIPHLG